MAPMALKAKPPYLPKAWALAWISLPLSFLISAAVARPSPRMLSIVAVMSLTLAGLLTILQTPSLHLSSSTTAPSGSGLAEKGGASH